MLLPQSNNSNNNSIRKEDLGFSPHDPCTRCGRQFERLKKEKVKGRAKLDRIQLPTFKKTVVGHDEVGNRIENGSAIRRNIHPFKHTSLLFHYVGRFDDKKFPTNPRLNPPRSTKNDRSPTQRFLEESFLYYAKVTYAICKTIPKIAIKYPQDTAGFFEDLIPHVNFMSEYWNSATDNRYKRSKVEWNEIVKYANKKSIEAASKKYYGITPDGEKDYLSRMQIKKKINEMKGFDEQFNEHIWCYLIGFSIVAMIIREDPELMEEYKKWSQEYDDRKDKEDDIISSSSHTYTYYYKIIHYDHNLYEKQKEECEKGLRKSKADGIIKICRIKESDIPLFSSVHK